MFQLEEQTAITRCAHYPGCDEGAGFEMKTDFTSVQNIYIICSKTDMRKGINGLAALIQDSFELDPYSDAM